MRGDTATACILRNSAWRAWMLKLRGAPSWGSAVASGNTYNSTPDWITFEQTIQEHTQWCYPKKAMNRVPNWKAKFYFASPFSLWHLQLLLNFIIDILNNIHPRALIQSNPSSWHDSIREEVQLCSCLLCRTRLLTAHPVCKHLSAAYSFTDTYSTMIFIKSCVSHYWAQACGVCSI